MAASMVGGHEPDRRRDSALPGADQPCPRRGRSRLLPAIHTNRGVGVDRAAAGPGALPLGPSRGEGGTWDGAAFCSEGTAP